MKTQVSKVYCPTGTYFGLVEMPAYLFPNVEYKAGKPLLPVEYRDKICYSRFTFMDVANNIHRGGR